MKNILIAMEDTECDFLRSIKSDLEGRYYKSKVSLVNCIITDVPMLTTTWYDVHKAIYVSRPSYYCILLSCLSLLSIISAITIATSSLLLDLTAIGLCITCSWILFIFAIKLRNHTLYQTVILMTDASIVIIQRRAQNIGTTDDIFEVVDSEGRIASVTLSKTRMKLGTEESDKSGGYKITTIDLNDEYSIDKLHNIIYNSMYNHLQYLKIFFKNQWIEIMCEYEYP
jgi:hypothetical protein